MTVCIAAMCGWPDGTHGVVGASDRMITVGDVQFEPATTKIFPLTNSIFALTSGESSVNAEITAGTIAEVLHRLTIDESWMTVEEAARIVGRHVYAYTMRMGELEVLGPLGLTRQTFLQHQRAHWFQDTLDKLFAFDSGSDLIVAGVDESGPHVWKVDGKGKPWCHDPAAFAAIGIGQRHAESQFQFAYHSKWMPFTQALFLTYKAKRRAEVAPGVGRIFTDMCVVPRLGAMTTLRFEDIDFLESLYKTLQEAERATARQHDELINIKFQQLFEAATAAAAQASDQQPTPPSPDDGAPSG